MFTTRQSTAITTHFPGFRRISIDDMRKTQVRSCIVYLLHVLLSDTNTGTYQFYYVPLGKIRLSQKLFLNYSRITCSKEVFILMK